MRIHVPWVWFLPSLWLFFQWWFIGVRLHKSFLAPRLILQGRFSHLVRLINVILVDTHFISLRLLLFLLEAIILWTAVLIIAFPRCWLLLILWLLSRWKVRSLVPWTVSVKLLHLLLKIHHVWVLSLVISFFDRLNWIFLSVDIGSYFLTLQSIPWIIVEAHILIELLLQLFKLVLWLRHLFVWFRF